MALAQNFEKRIGAVLLHFSDSFRQVVNHTPSQVRACTGPPSSAVFLGSPKDSTTLADQTKYGGVGAPKAVSTYNTSQNSVCLLLVRNYLYSPCRGTQAINDVLAHEECGFRVAKVSYKD